VMDINKSSSTPYWHAETTYFPVSWPGTQETTTQCAVHVTQHIKVDPNKKLLFSINGERNHVIYVCVQHLYMRCEGSNSATTVM
jgi:hypothetical protein